MKAGQAGQAGETKSEPPDHHPNIRRNDHDHVTVLCNVLSRWPEWPRASLLGPSTEEWSLVRVP